MMRVTDNIIQRNATLSLQSNLQRVAQAQAQVSSGQKYSSFADDPRAQSSIMESSGALRALDQYRRNIGDATARTNLEDSVLSQLTDAVDRAKEIAIQQGTSSSTASTRGGAKAEVDNLITFIASLGNTKYQDGYLFGGDNITDAPLTTSPPFYTTAMPPGGTHTTEIGAGQLFKSNHNAKEMLLDTGVLDSLKSLSTALGANDPTAIGASLSGLGTSQQGVQALVGDLGARQNHLDITNSNLDALETNLKTFKSNLSDVDQAQAMTDLVSRQTTYQAAMLATSRVIGMTVTNYLK
ncbi:MAG: flagellin [Gemmatimonadaceae bacterium]